MPTHWTRNKKLVLAWSIFSFLFFSSAVVLGVTSQIWRIQAAVGTLNDNTLRSLSISNTDLTGALILAIIVLISFFTGIFGFFSGKGKGKGEDVTGLVVFNWTLIVTMLSTIGVGSIIWFYTLTERDDYMEVWNIQNPATQAFLQDILSCCGYWNATSSGLFNQNSGFCATLPSNITEVTPCVTPITAFADTFLNNVFTTIYGFTAIQICLFFTTCCLIISRKEEERFRRIDEKRGVKGGFV